MDELIPEQGKVEFDEKEAKRKLEFIFGVLDRVSGSDTVSGKIYPILDPKNWKTTSYLSEGQVYSILAMLSLYNECPEEAEPCLDWCYNLCLLSISREGFGIDKAIDLGKALTQKGISDTARYNEPEKGTEGMRDKA